MFLNVGSKRCCIRRMEGKINQQRNNDKSKIEFFPSRLIVRNQQGISLHLILRCFPYRVSPKIVQE